MTYGGLKRIGFAGDELLKTQDGRRSSKDRVYGVVRATGVSTFSGNCRAEPSRSSKERSWPGCDDAYGEMWGNMQAEYGLDIVESTFF
jgi:hypothetical protein